MLVANNVPNFERNDLDIHFFRYSGGDHSGAAIWGGTRPFGDCHLKGTATLKALPLVGTRHLESAAIWGARHSGRREPLERAVRKQGIRRTQAIRGRELSGGCESLGAQAT